MEKTSFKLFRDCSDSFETMETMVNDFIKTVHVLNISVGITSTNMYKMIPIVGVWYIDNNTTKKNNNINNTIDMFDNI